MPMTPSDPIVLVENERTLDAAHESWQDITGVQYHYPNTYKNRVIEGRRFIYYRGVRRPNGARGSAEYFGAGRIGSVWPDSANATLPKTKWKWFCSIEDYQPFVSMVPSKVGGSYYERVSNPRDWGIGVRPISEATYERIVMAGGATPGTLGNLPALPPVALVNPVESNQLLVAIPRKLKARAPLQIRLLDVLPQLALTDVGLKKSYCDSSRRSGLDCRSSAGYLTRRSNQVGTLSISTKLVVSRSKLKARVQTASRLLTSPPTSGAPLRSCATGSGYISSGAVQVSPQ